ncbi:MAG: hypothetical protein C0510_02265 [Erythrobacter sp.]|nr:hypothetical protein [Erythrobacter sp.]
MQPIAELAASARPAGTHGWPGVPDRRIRGLCPLLALFAFLLSAGLAAAERAILVETQLQEGGEPVKLELVVHSPDGPGPFPLVLFNHGSTGSGDRPELFGRSYVAEAAAAFFTARGYVVVFPQRRGRGRSGGAYDEGFTLDRSRYSCDPESAGPAVERALDDIGAALAAARQLPEVSAGPALLAGHSRGGLLSLLHAARDPRGIGAVINFSGGWLGTACPDYAETNRGLFRQAGNWHGPSLFLYAGNDPFYPLKTSRSNHATFRDAGGQGRFFRAALPKGINGHQLVDHPGAWISVVDTFLNREP